MMRIAVLMPCRNEDWILGLSARAVLMWADELVILDHASTDRTFDIAMRVQGEYGPHRVTLLRDPDPLWQEMKHRQTLLNCARDHGATHLAIVDADEVLTANLLPSIREKFASMPTHTVLQLPWLCLRDSITNVHTSGVWAEQMVSCGFPDEPAFHWSSEGRGGYDFHHRHPMGRPLVPYQPVRNKAAGLMHLQFVSQRRLRAKQCLYKLTELLRWPERDGRDTARMVNQRYNLAVYGAATVCQEPSTRQIVSCAPFADWWGTYEQAGLLDYLNVDAEPWQEAKCREIIAEHGREKFAGLDLFGVV